MKRTPNVCPVMGTGVKGRGCDLCAERDQDDARRDHQQVPLACGDSLAEADRDEEIAERQATLEGRDTDEALGDHVSMLTVRRGR